MHTTGKSIANPTEMQALAWREDRYKAVYANAINSPTLRNIWREAYGESFAAEAEPFGFVTLSDLRRVALFLKGRTPVLDVGCGKGGPGLWVAREIGSELTGIDLVPEAIREANLFKQRFPNCPKSEFRVGSFTRTYLPSNTFSAVMSIDCFWMVLDKNSALREMARVMRSGSRTVMTTWIKPEINIKELIESAGFLVTHIEETLGWRDRQLGVYERIRSNEAKLRHEIGDDATRVLMFEATNTPHFLETSNRVMIVADKL